MGRVTEEHTEAVTVGDVLDAAFDQKDLRPWMEGCSIISRLMWGAFKALAEYMDVSAAELALAYVMAGDTDEEVEWLAESLPEFQATFRCTIALGMILQKRKKDAEAEAAE